MEPVLELRVFVLVLVLNLCVCTYLYLQVKYTCRQVEVFVATENQL